MSNEATNRKWTSTAGPIQTKKVNKALSSLNYEHTCAVRLSGVKEVDEQSYSYSSPFGGGHRADVAAVQQAIAEKYDYTVTAKNYKSILADVEAAMPALRAGRPVTDERRSPEDEAQRKADYEQRERERETESRLHADQVHAIEQKLRAEYPWALPEDGKLSRAARAAANLKTELTRAFPGVRFSVKSEYYSGGNEVRYSWELGPTKDAVSEIANKYRSASFNSMDDSTSYDQSAYGEAVSKVLGRAHSVSGSRNCDSVFQRIGELLCEAQQVEYKGNDTRNVFGSGDSRWLSDHVYEILGRTTFPVGAELIGIEHVDTWGEWYDTVKDLAQDDERRQNAPEGLFTGYVLKFSESPAYQPDAEYQSQDRTKRGGITVTENPAKGGIEIRFDSKAHFEAVGGSALKAYGFRWSRFQKLWYAKANARTREFAHSLAGDQDEQIPTTQNTILTPQERDVYTRAVAEEKRFNEDAVLDEPTDFERNLANEDRAFESAAACW